MPNTEIPDGLDLEPTVLLINPAELKIQPPLDTTPPNGVRALADVRRLGHSINNMLVPIMASLDLLDKNPTDSLVGREALQEAHQAVDQIRLLVLSYMESNRPKRLDLGALARDIVQVFDHSIQGRGVKLEVCAAPRITIVAPMADISEVLANLITNAADATPKGGIIKVRVDTDAPCGDEGEARAILEVADTGCGIPKHLVKHAFVTPFSSKEQGHGLGLPSIVAIMQGLKGRIKLTTAVGRGTTVQLRFLKASAA